MSAVKRARDIKRKTFVLPIHRVQQMQLRLKTTLEEINTAFDSDNALLLINQVEF